MNCQYILQRIQIYVILHELNMTYGVSHFTTTSTMHEPQILQRIYISLIPSCIKYGSLSHTCYAKISIIYVSNTM